MREILKTIPIRAAYKSREKEYGFQSDILKYLRNQGYFCYKIPDLGLASRLVDALVVDREGKTFYIEFKKTEGFSWNINKFEPAQHEFLSLLRDRGGEAYVMIYSDRTKTYIVDTYTNIISKANPIGTVTLFK